MLWPWETAPNVEGERAVRTSETGYSGDRITLGAIMPGADKMLDCFPKNGIRSAGISHLMWSGSALSGRLNRL